MPAPEARGSMPVRALHPLLRAAAAVLCGSLLCSACGKDTAEPQRPLPTPGIPRQRPTPTAILPPAANSPEATAYKNNNSAPSSAGARFDMPPARQPEQASEQVEVAKARDYSAELSQLMTRSAPGCLAGFDPSTKTSINVQVTAQVMSSGSISRAEVQAPGLTPPMLACMQKQAGALRLLGPIDGAPRSVTALVTLQTQGSGAPQPRAAATDTEDDRDENPRDSKIKEVENDPPEVMQKDEPVREAPEPPEPRDLPPTDTRADEQP